MMSEQAELDVTRVKEFNKMLAFGAYTFRSFQKRYLNLCAIVPDDSDPHIQLKMLIFSSS